MRGLALSIVFVWLAAFAMPASAAEGGTARTKKRWIVSVLMVAAAGAADVYSSRGGAELNPLMRNPAGRFSTGRAVALKSGLTGGVLLTQWLAIRGRTESGSEKAFTIANFGAAGALFGVAGRNLAVR